MDQPAESVECPICNKLFPTAKIQSHVSSCLFLSESNEPQQRTKRFLSQESSPSTKRQRLSIENHGSISKTQESSPSTKKQRLSIENHGNISKTPVSPQQPISSTQEQPTTSKNNSHNRETKQKESVPLSEKMRPTDIMSYIGQSHILGPQCMLYKLLSKSEIPNLILWGPPGCGKTSLANVIANLCKHSPDGKYRFVKLSAAIAGVSDVKEAITVARNELKFGRRSVIFMDEIHRFNKTQQDIFLPHIESGTIILIGATTENPSFSLNSALLSRCRVIVLEKLSIENLTTILEAAVRKLDGSIHNTHQKNHLSQSSQSSSSVRFSIDIDTIKWLAETSDGDARIALGGLELAIQSKVSNKNESSSQDLNLISLDDVKEGLKKTHMLYDRKGDQHYDIISALHKSVRASDENASLYWLTRMMAGGEDPVYIARRLVRMASEDIGLEDPKALGIAVHTMHACKMLGMPDCDVLLAQCTTYLARAPKSRLMEDALRAAQLLVATQKGAQPSVPIQIRNAPTTLMKNLGYGKGYNMLHKEQSGLTYLPEEHKDANFFGQE